MTNLRFNRHVYKRMSCWLKLVAQQIHWTGQVNEQMSPLEQSCRGKYDENCLSKEYDKLLDRRGASGCAVARIQGPYCYLYQIILQCKSDLNTYRLFSLI